MNRLILFIAAGVWLLNIINACKPDPDNKDPQYIIEEANKVHGIKVYDNSIIDFRIGNRYYKSTHHQGQFRYERYWDSLGMTIHDELTSRGLIRHVGQTNVLLETKKIDQHSYSLRSLFFLFSIPFWLNDLGVVKEYLGEVILMEQPYHKIKITFRKNPNDRTIYDDVYVVWIHKTRFTLDYVGYLHTGSEGQGIRFRQAINPRKVEGFRVQNYLEFKPVRDSISIKPEDLDQAWAGNQLMPWEKIEILQLKIRPE